MYHGLQRAYNHASRESCKGVKSIRGCPPTSHKVVVMYVARPTITAANLQQTCGLQSLRKQTQPTELMRRTTLPKQFIRLNSSENKLSQRDNLRASQQTTNKSGQLAGKKQTHPNNTTNKSGQLAGKPTCGQRVLEPGCWGHRVLEPGCSPSSCSLSSPASSASSPCVPRVHADE